jgi:hypothetical protein
MGQIRKRGKFYQIRYYRNGQRIEESTGFTKYDEARDLLKKREGAVADGVPITARSTPFLFDDAVKDVVSITPSMASAQKPTLSAESTCTCFPFSRDGVWRRSAWLTFVRSRRCVSTQARRTRK